MVRNAEQPRRSPRRWQQCHATGGNAHAHGADHAQGARVLLLSDDEILQFGRWAATVEAHYGHAMDMEWAKDGETDELYLVQACPETVVSARRAG
jgi:pyruvate,water dikinase